MHRSPHFVLFAGAALAAALTSPRGLAQLQRGHSIAAVISQQSPTIGELWDIDHATGTATRLSIPSRLRDIELPEAILMDTRSADPTGALTRGWAVSLRNSNVFELTLGAGGVTARPMNTNLAAGRNPAQLVRVGNELFFTTQKGNGADGVLHKIDVQGGAIQQLADLAKAGARNPVNACAQVLNSIFCCTYNAGTFANGASEVIEYDLSTQQATKLMDLPAGLFGGFGIGVVAAHAVPVHPTRLALFGLFGEYLEVDVLQRRVMLRRFTGTGLTAGGENRSNCAVWNPVGQDWIVGTRDGAIDVWADGHSAEQVVTGIGSGRFAVLNSLSAIDHNPFAAGSDRSIGPGCPGPGGFTATDVSFGAPARGNGGFRLGLYSGSGGDPFLLSIGVQALPAPFDLGAIGAPGCRLYVQQVVALRGGVTGAGDGAGTVVVPVPIPAGVPKGVKVLRQWLLGNRVPVNGLGVTVSNAREIEFR